MRSVFALLAHALRGAAAILSLVGLGSLPAAGLLFAMMPRATAQVSNDECAGAPQVVVGSNGPFSNYGATTSLPAFPCGVGRNDVWFVFMGPQNGIATFDTCGSGFDTVLQVFDANVPGNHCGSNFPVPGPCNDDSPCGTGNLQSSVSLPVLQGGVYYVRVGGYNGAVGSFGLNIACAAPPDDECRGATVLSAGGNGPYSTVGYTSSTPSWPCGQGGNDRWFSYTPAATAVHTFALCGAGTNFDTVLEVFAGTCQSGLTSLACNNDACGVQSQVTVSLVQGVPYLLRVGGQNGATGVFTVAVTAAPADDECSGATPITVGSNGPYSTVGYTSSAPGWACGNGGNDRWFRFTAPISARFRLALCGAGTNFDTVLEVFAGTCQSGLTSLACNNDACGVQSQVTVSLIQGVPYLLRVGGQNGATGVFTVAVTAAPADDECSGATPITVGSNGPYSTVGYTSSAPGWACGNGGNDRWFRFTAATTATHTFALCGAGTSFDTVLEVFSGQCQGLTSLACNNDACGLQSQVTLNLVQGVSYLLRVGGQNGATGSLVLTVSRLQAQPLPTPPAAPDLHPEALRLRSLWRTNPSEFYRQVFAELVQRRIPKTYLLNEQPMPPLPQLLPPAGLVLDDAFFAELSFLLEGQDMPERGLTDSTTPAADLRLTNFFAPYASEFLGVWSGFTGAPGAPAARDVALREIGIQAAQLARKGFTAVKLWYPFNAWKYRFAASAGGPTTSLALSEVLDILRQNGLDVLLTLGNNYGSGSLEPTGDNARFVVQTAATAGMPMPAGARYLLLDRQPEKSLYGFYSMPGNDYLEALTDAEFQTFKAGEWNSYVTHVVAAIAGQPAGAVRALQIWNEPDGTPTGVVSSRPGYGKVALRVGELMAHAKTQWANSGLRPGVALMVGVGGPVTLLTWAVANLDRLEPRFLKNHVTWFGFHPASVHMHTSAPYLEGSRVYPGWPPGSNEPPFALKDTNRKDIPSATRLFGAFLALHRNSEGLLEELAIRGWANQVLTDVDDAFRVRKANSAGLGPWSGVAAKGHLFATTLATGATPLPREELVLQDRWRLGGRGHTASAFDGRGIGPADRKVQTPRVLSRALRPLLLGSPVRTDDSAETTLLAFADAYDDVPTHCQYRSYPATRRAGDRFRIWTRGIRRVNGAEYESALQPLDAVVVNAGLATLTEDPAFRDVDDNVAISQWPVGLIPTRASHLTPPSLLETFWLAAFPNALGMVPIDLTFGGRGGGPVAVPLPANPCQWPGYRAGVPVLERELMIRAQLAAMQRMRHAGVSGQLVGTYLREERSGGQLIHHFAIAYHRLVWQSQQPGEHYGPSEEALSAADATRAWSNNYGDPYSNKKGHSLAAAAHDPCKLEVVVVDVAVAAPLLGGAVSLSGAAQVLPTLGDHADAMASGPRGAEAIDPVLGAAEDGTLVIAYRKSQDAFFYFPEPAPLAPFVPWAGYLLDGPMTGGCGGYFLPVPYPSPVPGKDSWASFLRSPQLHVWTFPWDLYLRVRSAGSQVGWSNEVRLSEAAFPTGGSAVQEDWNAWVTNLANLEDRHGNLRAAKRSFANPYFNQGWAYPATSSPPSVLISDPHTWHPALQATLSVGRRSNGELPVVVAWAQYPRAQRLLPDGSANTYVPVGLRLRFDAGNALIAAPTVLQDFGSGALHAALMASGSPVGASLRDAPQAILREDLTEPRAWYQQGPDLAAGNGSTLSERDAFTQGTVRLRSIQAAITPTLALDGGVPTQLELSASLRPEPTAGSARQTLELRVKLPQRGIERVISPPEAITSDPHAEVVAVIPYAADRDAPGRRVKAGVTYDQGRDRVVVYGGNLTTTTWEFDGTAWLRRTPPRNPGVRLGPALAYHPVDRKVYLFGGHDAAGRDQTDTWSYDGVDWSPLPAAGGPAVGNEHQVMVWTGITGSAPERLLLFTGAATPATAVWEWNSGTSGWVAHASPGIPAVPLGFALTWYLNGMPGNGLLLTGAGATADESWIWNGAWSLSTATRHAPRVGASLTGSLLAVQLEGGRSLAGVPQTGSWAAVCAGQLGGWSAVPGTRLPAAMADHRWSGTDLGQVLVGGAPFQAPGTWRIAFTGMTPIPNPEPTVVGRVVWKADGTIWWADYDWLCNTVLVQRVNATLPGPFPARDTEVAASADALLWTHDGSILTRRL